ncbi:hypothetical protein XPA_003261 [Xanthoria parietina]
MASPAPTIQPYHSTLADPDLFQNVTYAINQVQSAGVPTSVTNAYAAASNRVQKNVGLLDHIALLLVYKAKDDVVATAILPERASFTLLWAKNSDYVVSSLEHNYLTSLLRAFAELQPPLRILEIVAGMCKMKILSRVKKLVDAAPQVGGQTRNFFNIVEGDPRTETMRRCLVESGIMGDQPLADGLDEFLAAARGLGTDSAVESFVDALVFSFWLGLNMTGPKLDSVPGVNPKLFRRVKKLGAWFHACLVIYMAVKVHSPAVRQGIQLWQLTPSSPAAHRPYRNTLDALNTWTARYNLPRFENFEVVQDIYREATPGTPGPGPNHEIAAAQHCELTVGLELWGILHKKNSYRDIEIGCSKASCFYCSLWIEKFNRWVYEHHWPYKKIILRRQRDKFSLGWAMPAHSPAKVRDGVLEGVGNVIQGIWNAAGDPQRRSDSLFLHTEEADKAAELDYEAGWGWGRVY